MSIKSDVISGVIIVAVVLISFFTGKTIGYRSGAIDGTKDALSWAICIEFHGGDKCDSLFVKMMENCGTPKKEIDSILTAKHSKYGI